MGARIHITEAPLYCVWGGSWFVDLAVFMTCVWIARVGEAVSQGPAVGRYRSTSLTKARRRSLQKYFPPQDHRRSLGIGLLHGPRGWQFFMSE